jgi:hypothetical protein
LRKKYGYAKAMSFIQGFKPMITILKKKTGKTTTFKNYQACHKHIRVTEGNRQAPILSSALDSWVLMRHSPRRVLAFYEYVCQQRKASQQNQGQKLLKRDVLEICLDGAQKPLLIPVTPDMDYEVFLQDWCRVYFQSHGYEFYEVIGTGAEPSPAAKLPLQPWLWQWQD